MTDKLIDASKPGAPLPAWRWLVWYIPSFSGAPPDFEPPQYLVYGSDDLAEAKAVAAEYRGRFVAQNPVWRTIN
jgi:hypothetical protein